MPDRATFNTHHWKDYITANKEFANCTMTALRRLKKETQKQNGTTNNLTGPNDAPLIWIHDYHLMLAANWIRQVCPALLLANNDCFLLTGEWFIDAIR